eukprot:TRINITY_DN1859_c0_g1_i4.p1 TRINITY_DN1859_c0_g1~~TRINITY_DN1859_c0_g1_i4.p1  ORF type:complete len:305 (+),score=100.26 TRINITY_DN1859_c0_g1_i4:173-1087(+)
MCIRDSFWMQEPNEAKDEQLHKEMNELLGSSPAADAPADGDAEQPAASQEPDQFEGMSEEDAAAMRAAMELSMQVDEPEPEPEPAPTPMQVEAEPVGDTEEQAALDAALAMSMGIDPDASADAADDDEAALQAAMALSMQGAEPSPASAPAPAAGRLSNEDMARVRNLLAGIQVPEQAAAGSQVGLDLASVLDPDSMSAVVADPEVQARLLEHLPDSLRSPQEVSELLRSPQFQQALDGISQVLVGPQMYQVLQSMGIDPGSAPRPGLEGFYEALIQHAAARVAAPAPAPAPQSPPDDDSDLYD